MNTVSNTRSGLADQVRLSNFITKLQREREWRPTVVVIIENELRQIGIGRQKNTEANWGVVQGEIHPEDETWIAAGIRECQEELGIPPEALELTDALLHTGQCFFSDRQPTCGYRRGKWYFCIGMRLVRASLVQLVPMSGEKQEIHEWKWVEPHEACRLCVEQPDVSNSTKQTRQKGTLILEPAIRKMVARSGPLA